VKLAMPRLLDLARTVNTVLHRFDLHLTRHGYRHKPFIDKAFWGIHEKWHSKTMIPWQGCYDAYSAAKYVAQSGIEGDIVECGVWKGGSSIIMAETLGAYGCADKSIYMYDTFSGMTEPDSRDVSFQSHNEAHLTWKKRQNDTHNAWAYAGLEEVRDNVGRADCSFEKFIFVKGDVCQTIPEVVPEKISILRLDTDWYKSTYHEMLHLFPRLSIGGVLIVDDYGTYSGARDAVDDYLKEWKVPIHLASNHRYGAAVGVKVTD
jgi:predicted O-methyltransferase YrrM